MGLGHEHEAGPGHRRALALALAITASFTLVEVVGGFLTGSLAVLADAVHMLSDNLSITLALVAGWLAAKPATPERTYGYKRAEVLAALANGVHARRARDLDLRCCDQRLESPQDVLGGWMVLIAVVGIGVNLAAGAILFRARAGSLNVEAAFRHVIADLLGSFGVAVAGVIILATGWLQADALVSILIGVLVLASSWTILRDATTILLEAAPKGIETSSVGSRLAAAPGVVEVHDLHIWTITSGFPALSAHVLVARGEDCHRRRRELERLLGDEFGIEHTTLQVDHVGDAGLVELGRFGKMES